MKNIIQLLLPFWFCSTFGQAYDTTQPLRHFDKTLWSSGGSTLTITHGQNGEPDLLTLDIKMRPHYDTLRAVMLVTLSTSRMGIAHARGGYVVMKGSEVVKYLDCRYREIKQPGVVWGWKRKNRK